MKKNTVFFIIIFVIFSIPASAFHYDSLAIRHDCPICKFSVDFSSAEGAATYPILIPDVSHSSFSLERPIRILGILTVVLTTRAPPRLSLPNIVT